MRGRADDCDSVGGYGVWFLQVRHEWYEKDPDTVTEAEFANLPQIGFVN